MSGRGARGCFVFYGHTGDGGQDAIAACDPGAESSASTTGLQGTVAEWIVSKLGGLHLAEIMLVAFQVGIQAGAR